MNLVQYLCQLISEECGEITQRASKMSRFGYDEVQKGQSLDNYERLRIEKVDLDIIFSLLVSATKKQNDFISIPINENMEKQKKLLKYSRLSVDCDQITESVYQELLSITYFRDDSDMIKGIFK